MIKPRIVKSKDNIDLMIITLNTTYCDSITGFYLSDINGVFIDKALSLHMIDNYYITAFIKDDNAGITNKKILHQHYETIFNEIESVKPKIILLLGKSLTNYFYDNSDGLSKQINKIKNINLFNKDVIGSRKKVDKEIKYTDIYYNFISCYSLADITNGGVLDKNNKKIMFRDCLFIIKDYLEGLHFH